MLDIPKDTPLLLLIYSDLSEFISGYYAKFFVSKIYCLGKNQFNEHEWVYQILFPFCLLFQVYFRLVTLVAECSVLMCIKIILTSSFFIVPKDACVRQSMEFLLFLELTQTRKEKTLHLGDSIIRPQYRPSCCVLAEIPATESFEFSLIL